MNKDYSKVQVFWGGKIEAKYSECTEQTRKMTESCFWLVIHYQSHVFMEIHVHSTLAMLEVGKARARSCTRFMYSTCVLIDICTGCSAFCADC